ncbi:NAD(P)H-dependent oxidoreductase subunit E [Desulfopila sp. IMCC35008]|uniref:NADH-quinone oxidoreductase subunit NuoE family protein n=1 Tax=Desulfopila sp. IMCC35008 TaxID=2653858 RepID=UPI0013D21882|nr:NAD(P)H-dependent oxidoreductase subunit E [Desulfopila sp. IMCC35008]
MTRMIDQVEEILESIYSKNSSGGDNIIAILQDIQNELGYIQEDAVDWFARRTGIPASRFYGVVTFYSQFHLTPRGKNIVTVCSGTVCHVKGAPRIVSRLQQDLHLKDDNGTTKDMQFTVENVNCVGACSIAPVVLVNEKVFGKQTPEKMIRNLKPYK